MNRRVLNSIAHTYHFNLNATYSYMAQTTSSSDPNQHSKEKKLLKISIEIMKPTRFKMHPLLSLLVLLNYPQIIWAQGLISKSQWNSPATSNGQSTRENQWDINRPGENWVVAEVISCWEQNDRWEEEQVCPDSKIVTAHRFRHLSRTGLTGIELKCTEKNGRDETEKGHLLRIDFEGQVDKNLPRGGWESWKNGSTSVFAQGFSFSRGEMSLRRSVKNYDLIYHSRNQRQSVVDLDLDLDSDKIVTRCPADHAICGVTAMMDKARLGILTAIGLKCCHHCVPEEKWVNLDQHDNTSPSDWNKQINTTVGLDLKKHLQNGPNDSVKVNSSLLAEIFAQIKKSKSTGFDWSRAPFVIWAGETATSKTFRCDAESSCVFKQVVGQCGSVRVPVNKFCRVSVPIGSSIPDSCNLNDALESKSITSCRDAMEFLPSYRSDKQWIYPYGTGNGTRMEVLCDFETDGGGWTVIQRKSSGPHQEFDRNWTDYVNGFGCFDGNFWLGLDNMHALTKNHDQEMRFDLEDFEGEKRWAKYSRLKIEDASELYRWDMSTFSGTAGDSVIIFNGFGMPFTTRDKDNDNWEDGNCADRFGGGGWWYNQCGNSETEQWGPGMLWHSWIGYNSSLAKSEIKLRKKKT